jgi:VCBS repeat protein
MRTCLRMATIPAAALALASGAAAGPKPFGTVTTLQFAKGIAPRAAVLADVDGDGLDDLVIATSRRGGRAERAIEVHLRRREGDVFAAAADFSFDLPTDVTAFAVGDVHEDAGSEIVLFTASGAFAWRPKGPEDARFARLVTGSFLWQLPDAHDVFAYELGVRDVDGDGLADVVLPEPEGWRVAVQRRAAGGPASFATVSAPRMPLDTSGEDQPIGSRKMQAKAKRNEVRIAIQVGDDESELPQDLVDVTESVPAPQFADFDGDGRADLLAQTSHDLCVWRQRADATFPETPDATYELPVPADRERRLDVSYGSHVADVDGDLRADCVMLAGDKRSDDVRTQVLVYVQGKAGAPDPASPLFGAKGLPTQLLRIGGFAGSPAIVDVDGDGRRDLVLGSVRLDGTLDVAKVTGNGSLDAELYVFKNRGAGFADRPDLTFPVQLKAEGLRKTRREITAEFFGDVTGDGVRDLLLRDDPEHLRVLMTRKTGDGLSVVPQALWETHVEPEAEITVHDAHRGPPELIVVEDAQVLHVRFP